MTFEEIENLVTQIVTWLFGSGIGAMIIGQIGSTIKTYCKSKADSKSVNASVKSSLDSIKDETLALVENNLKSSLNASFAVDVSAQINEKIESFIGGVRSDVETVKNEFKALELLMEDIAGMYAKSRALTADEKAELKSHIDACKSLCKEPAKAENVIKITYTEPEATVADSAEKIEAVEEKVEKQSIVF